MLIGQTGIGKTFIAQAVGLHACASGYSVLYTTVTTWLENLALARSSGTYLRYRDKLAKPDLIIFDDIGMRKLSSTEAQDLCEILEERSIGKSVAFTTQLPLEHWAEVIADPVIADAIRDRLAHAALTIDITGRATAASRLENLPAGKGRVRLVALGSASDPLQVVPNSGNRVVLNEEILQQSRSTQRGRPKRGLDRLFVFSLRLWLSADVEHVDRRDRGKALSPNGRSPTDPAARASSNALSVSAVVFRATHRQLAETLSQPLASWPFAPKMDLAHSKAGGLLFATLSRL